MGKLELACAASQSCLLRQGKHVWWGVATSTRETAGLLDSMCSGGVEGEG